MYLQYHHFSLFFHSFVHCLKMSGSLLKQQKWPRWRKSLKQQTWPGWRKSLIQQCNQDTQPGLSYTLIPLGHLLFGLNLKNKAIITCTNKLLYRNILTQLINISQRCTPYSTRRVIRKIQISLCLYFQE